MVQTQRPDTPLHSHLNTTGALTSQHYFQYLFVEDDAEVTPANGCIRKLHEVLPCKQCRLLAATDATPLCHTK